MATAAINTRMRRAVPRGRGHHRVLAVTEQPTKWERLLARLGTTAEEATQDIRRGKGGHAYELREWVESNWLKTYVPEEILEAAELRQEIDAKWDPF